MPAPRVARWMSLTACLWIAFFAASATWQVWYGFGRALEGYPQPVVKLGLLLLMAAVVATAVATLMLPVVWRTSSWSVWRRVRHSLALTVLIVTTLALQQWNAVGLHYY